VNLFFVSSPQNKYHGLIAFLGCMAGEPVLTASPTVQATGASADATGFIAATIADDNSTVAPTSAPTSDSTASAETTIAPTSAPTAADPLLNYTNSVFIVDMKVRGTTNIRQTAASPVTSAPTAANDTKPTARRTARKTSTTTPAAPVRRGLLSGFTTFEKVRRQDHAWTERMRRYTASPLLRAQRNGLSPASCGL
jgi:hypothetical protein